MGFKEMGRYLGLPSFWAILTAIPAYSIAILKFPKGFYKDLNSLVTESWWATKTLKEIKYIGRVGYPYKDQKNQSGMGRRGNKHSWLWGSLFEGRDVLEGGTQYNIGQGDDILIWEDKWISNLANCKLHS
ncbi:conserved hypothetical protein [Ricinus communis]|uniref:Uncharacterized protein n=1 Tax=Ricinus communis TaxID=3988 RepID=B9RL69_RICCO|nr:conserved hypothetical protein [Ricinus communis]